VSLQQQGLGWKLWLESWLQRMMWLQRVTWLQRVMWLQRVTL
jgi:hypothetical protein